MHALVVTFARDSNVLEGASARLQRLQHGVDAINDRHGGKFSSRQSAISTQPVPTVSERSPAALLSAECLIDSYRAKFIERSLHCLRCSHADRQVWWITRLSYCCRYGGGRSESRARARRRG